MSETITRRDPVQGLVDFVLDVKPFHTKILEVWVEYIYGDLIAATVKDEVDFEIHVDFNRIEPCKYGWDTTPWDKFWNIKDESELPQGVIEFIDNGVKKTIAEFDAYRLFFEYLSALWISRTTELIEPKADASENNPFRILWLPQSNGSGLVVSKCGEYWATTVLSNQFWFDPRHKKLYRHKGNEWVEQPFFYTSIVPVDVQVGDYWFCIGPDKLYTRVEDGWAEIRKFYIAYDVPKVAPTYPDPWMSNWDYPECNGPTGENHIYARVTDLLSFEHGSEIFLFDTVRTAVMDPNSRRVPIEEYKKLVARPEYPVKYKTTVIQTSKNRYTMQREEISVITQPDNPDVKSSVWTFDLNDFSLDGWDPLHARKDVKLGGYLVWKFTPQGMKLIRDSIINSQTFRLKAVNGALVAQKTTDTGVEDIAVPWANGSVIYLRSTDDLPQFKNPTTGKRAFLQRYTPYKVVKLTDTTFGLAYANGTSMNGKGTFELVDSGSGRMYIGLGYPEAFMEVRTVRSDSMTGSVKEKLGSSTDVFLDHELSQIIDIALGYPGKDGSSFTGFVVKGNFSNHKKGSKFSVGGSKNKTNDGIWTVDKINTYTNAWQSFELDGTPVPTPAPVWWNVQRLGEWPMPVKKPQSEIDSLVASNQYAGFESEYTYLTWSLIAVSNSIPTVTDQPLGFVAEANYNFNEGTGPNAARTTVKDRLIFGSLKATMDENGITTFTREVGVPGMEIWFKDRIAATIQEGLNRDDPYGGLTIGSYDATYFDQDTYDENLDTVIRRMQSQ